MDIVIFDSKHENYVRVEVKSKQIDKWSQIHGINGNNLLLICVDFYNKEDTERPDFYILTEQDWLYFLKNKYEQELLNDETHKRKVVIDNENIPCWINQKVKNRKSCFKGADFKPEEIMEYKDKWEKVRNLLK